jgi:hypothetical protein
VFSIVFGGTITLLLSAIWIVNDLIDLAVRLETSGVDPIIIEYLPPVVFAIIMSALLSIAIVKYGDQK